ncbi:sensor histidine kinase [Mesonia maritima]|uniref:Sensor histidine kinase YesM n=1 Tax=Mesonia maritima TaxID=1793873 RepID=A0ABU1K4L2_9FLAO|nr:histidine kinase [Mesonia maritima]MDR6300554.1 sensor histidine kinase YesM [Mesonia maritima]
MEFVPELFFWQLMVTALSILGIISLVIGYNSKEKSFLFYFVYTFFLLFYFILMTPYDVEWRDQLYTTSFKSLRWYSQVIYNCSYFLFFLYFLDVRTHLYKFYKFIIKVVAIMFSIASLVFLYSILSVKPEVFDFFYIYIFVPVLFCFAIYTLIKSFFLPGRLKYFFITGGGIFIVFAMIALFFPIMRWRIFNIKPFFIFYIGIYIEQFVFAFGLAYKVKLINLSLLEKSLENQQIKEKQNQFLEEKLKEKENEILFITAKAEEERISRLKSKFEDEIHHLHLVSLQNQMNPHFIFNALNSIKFFLIENDKEEAIYYLNKFSKLIRIILESVQVESITLEKELSILELYVNIENIRFEDKIELKINKPKNSNLKNIMVPPMIFQPFIENSIWHGLMLRKGKKKITLNFSKVENTLVLKINDNGIGRKKSMQNLERKFYRKKSIGLKINKERLKHFNQKRGLNYSFKINDLKNEEGKSSGTEIEFLFTNPA